MLQSDTSKRRKINGELPNNELAFTLNFDLKTACAQTPVSYNPIKLGEFSLSKSRDYGSKVEIPLVKNDIKLPLNLNEGFRNWSDTVEVPNLNVLFRWICDNNFVINNIDVLTYRGLLKKIAMTKFDTYKNHWCVRLSKLYSTIIMDEIETDEQRKKRQSESYQQKKFQYYGHKFEQEVLQFENEMSESDIVVTSKVGKLRCLFAAEVDGRTSSGDIVELKTHRVLITDHHKTMFRKSKLLNTYLQCYIAGIEKTCFGFRDQQGFITQIENYTLNEIEELCKKDWDRNVILSFLSDVLSWALSRVEDDKVYHLSYSGSDEIQLQQVEHVDYIPDWFVAHAMKCNENE